MKSQFTIGLGKNYNPHDIEEKVKVFWDEENIYGLVKEKLKGRKRFYFLDGPPYPSSPTFHPGTGWNKIIKDSVLRYKRLCGYDVVDTPGYDTHGLPIEVKIEKELGVNTKKDISTKLGIDLFIERCKDFVLKNVDALTRGFKDLGVMMDWEKPYLTLHNSYIENSWQLIKMADEKGLLDIDLRVVHWCPRCETVLADYEVSQEYREITDPSIYVKFPVEGEDKTYIVIWTTTPWTIPANTFVMARSDAPYVKIRYQDEYLIMSEVSAKRLFNEDEYSVVERYFGKDLEGLRYTHPLHDLVDIQKKLHEFHKVVLADKYVNLEEGTGFVHSAPGHGAEDFDVAKTINAPVYSLIDDEGRFTRDAGKYFGMYFREANDEIIKDLESRGYLLRKGRITHRYPLCWRCKTPLLLRATRQWIIRASRLRDLAVSEINKVNWIPRWAHDRIASVVENMQDWVISRQRFWGIPLPIWVCSSCGNRVVVGKVSELANYSPNIYPPKDLHRPWIDQVELKCPKCNGTMKRVPDVADVWLDSGVAFYASLGDNGLDKFNKLENVDFIVEGHDQTRGWFFSLLRSGLILVGRSPYKTVLVHGFVLDEKGREMHKSLGNFVEVAEIIRKHGRDPFRLFMLSSTVWEDLRFSDKKIQEARRILNIVWNVYSFAKSYMEVDNFKFDRSSIDKYSGILRVEDRWILSRFYSVLKNVSDKLEGYRIHEAVDELVDFMVNDISHLYLRIIKRRVWIEENTDDKLAVYTVLFKILRDWIIAFSIVAPHISEYIYQGFVRSIDGNNRSSVNLENWPNIEEYRRFHNDELEKAVDVLRDLHEALLSARMKAGIKVRRPVEKCLVLTNNDHISSSINTVGNLIKELVNCSEVVVDNLSNKDKYMYRDVEPDLSRIGREFKGLSSKIVDFVKSNQDLVIKELTSKGYIEFSVDGHKVKITRDHVKVLEKFKPDYAFVERDWGYAGITLKVSDELLALGIARELVRRIQVMRKELNLDLLDEIKTAIYVDDQDLVNVIMKVRDYIMNETRSIELNVTSGKEEIGNMDLVREWDIDGALFIIGIVKVR